MSSINSGKFLFIIFSNVSSATFFHLQQLLPSHTGYCHSSSVVCLPHVLVCITSTGVSLRSGHFPSLCHHLMSTSKQFFTSADTLCLVWDLDSRVFLVLLSLGIHHFLHAGTKGNPSPCSCSFPRNSLPLLALWHKAHGGGRAFLSSAPALVIDGPCAPQHLTPALWWQRVSSGSFLPSHQEADFRFVSIQGLSSEIPIFI